MTPELFAPGIVSRDNVFEHSSVYFTQDLKEFCWLADPGSPRDRQLLCAKYEEGIWSDPVALTFSKHYSNSNLAFSDDGNRMYFTSRIPLDYKAALTDDDFWQKLKDPDLWHADRINDKWTEPVNLGPAINSDGVEALGTVLPNGTIYYSDYRDIFRSEMKDGKYQQPAKLSAPINLEGFDLAPFVARDESYLIFESFRPDSCGGADLYISYKTPHDSWGDPINLGETINTGGHERSPYISPDGKYLFFWRVTNTSNIYWVDAKVIEDLKADNLK